MNADVIRSTCAGRKNGDIKVAVYDRLIKFMSPDPKNKRLCDYFEDNFHAGQFVSKDVFYITHAEYENDKFWMTPIAAASSVATSSSSNDGTVIFPGSTTREQALLNLWDSTRALGMGALHSHHQPTLDEAEQHLAQSTYVDYFFGKPIKTEFSTYPSLKNRLYDRDAGAGVMQKVAEKTAIVHGPTKKLTSDEAEAIVDKYNSQIKVQFHSSEQS